MDLLERSNGLQSRLRHPWESARLLHVERLLARYGVTPQDAVLDVGSGDGYVVAELLRRGRFETAVCSDPNYSNEDLAKAEPRIQRLRELPDQTFPLVLSLDVIEHASDDLTFIRDIVEHCMANGSGLLVTAPAYQALYSNHDRALGHYRRYSRRVLAQTVAAAGLDIVDSGYFFTSLLPIRAIQHLAQHAEKPEAVDIQDVSHLGTWNRGRWATTTVHKALDMDNRTTELLRRTFGLRVPGLSTWVYATS